MPSFLNLDFNLHMKKDKIIIFNLAQIYLGDLVPQRMVNLAPSSNFMACKSLNPSPWFMTSWWLPQISLSSDSPVYTVVPYHRFSGKYSWQVQIKWGKFSPEMSWERAHVRRLSHPDFPALYFPLPHVHWPTAGSHPAKPPAQPPPPWIRAQRSGTSTPLATSTQSVANCLHKQPGPQSDLILPVFSYSGL